MKKAENDGSFLRTPKGRTCFCTKVCVVVCVVAQMRLSPSSSWRWASLAFRTFLPSDGEAASMPPHHCCLPAAWQRYTDLVSHVELLSVCVCVFTNSPADSHVVPIRPSRASTLGIWSRFLSHAGEAEPDSPHWGVYTPTYSFTLTPSFTSSRKHF